MADPRLRLLVDAPVRAGRHVLYWMIAARRAHHSFALDRALGHARALDRPLVVLEALRCDHRCASDRFHRFVIEGMADNHRAFERAGVVHHAYVEPTPGAGAGLLEALAAEACVVVTDDWPCFFVPRMQAAAAARLAALGVRLEAVDGAGLYPFRDTDRVFARAHDFRRHLHRALPEHLGRLPHPDPLRAGVPAAAPLDEEITRRWPSADFRLLEPGGLATLDIDHRVAPVDGEVGGSVAGARRLAGFVGRRLSSYPDRNHPDDDASSRLSAHLHFGHVGAHQALVAVAEAEDWTPERIADRPTGKRHGWWGMSEAAEAFLDELVTWREVAMNASAHLPGYDRYDTLPDWARRTLAAHAGDPRPVRYDLDTLDAAGTHDEIWNAAQRQLVGEGRIHNYLRMLWGKKILEWSPTPEEAMRVMIALNDRYALDGRDPNSYAGIAWVLGRYDRAWGPERPIFGKVRYMSSDNTRRKLRMREYLERWS